MSLRRARRGSAGDARLAAVAEHRAELALGLGLVLRAAVHQLVGAADDDDLSAREAR